MDWGNELKILNRALKQYKTDKNKLELRDAVGYNNGDSNLRSLILQKEMLIQNIESRIKIIKKKLLEEDKKS